MSTGSDAWTAASVPVEEAAEQPESPEGGRVWAATFSGLVRAHRAWEQELYEREHDRRPADRAIEHEFHRRWRQFEGRFGEVVDAYWSVRDASAVALTVGQKRSLWRRREYLPKFHRATDWATRDEPAIAEALDDCETLAVKAEEILRGPAELIALRRVYAVASHLLGFVDRTWGRGGAPEETRVAWADHRQEADEFVARQRKELASIERFYDRAGNRQARIVFFLGMTAGLFVLLPVMTFVATLIWAVDGLDGVTGHWTELQTFLVSVAAGAVGAMLSVLTRMASLTGKFSLDYEVGRKQVRWLGVYRPFLGAIFGVATFLLLASGLLQTDTPGEGSDFAYYGALAFLAGFFERFMKVAPGGVPKPLESAAEEKDEEGKPAPA